MNSDDLDNKTTQPMIADVFKLVEEVKQSMEAGFAAVNARIDETNARIDQTNAQLAETNARIDQTNARLDKVESRLARDIEALDTRVVKGFKDLNRKITILNQNTLQVEADHEDLLDRVEQLESKAS